MPGQDRIEVDALGAVPVPAGALYGAQTARAIGNFPLSGRTLGSEPAFVAAFAQVKRAAARANAALGVVPAETAEAIAAAAADMAAGSFNADLVVDLFEGSGGTSLNMNVNEVLANAAQRRLGGALGVYDRAHPNDHVNRSQSTNDVTPTAIKLACRAMLAEAEESFRALAAAARRKAAAFSDHLRLGRTCLQDAQPMTLGQAVGAWASFAERSAGALAAQREALLELPLGATAIGAGFGAAPGYRARAVAELSELVGAPCRSTPDLFDGLANADVYARLSGEMKAVAGGLGKIAGDLVLLSSGPRGGLSELALPDVQPGSSIMPGKVNPVIPLAVCQVGFAVAGYDAVVGAACQQGQLEINPYEPVIAAHLFDEIRLTTRAARLLRERCLEGLEAHREHMLQMLLESSAVATALIPRFGYAAASALVRRARTEGREFLALAEETGVLNRHEALVTLRAAAGLEP
ncbi:lyase family protein [Phenylobacterium sp.]|uniref:lyase family protein n=1 Tax=Phenylobacterium sp. TaxID=1871053 RepID=UPI0035ADBC9F